MLADLLADLLTDSLTDLLTDLLAVSLTDLLADVLADSLPTSGKPGSVSFHGNTSKYLGVLRSSQALPKTRWLMMQMGVTHQVARPSRPARYACACACASTQTPTRALEPFMRGVSCGHSMLDDTQEASMLDVSCYHVAHRAN